jgi:hypothetical protein
MLARKFGLGKALLRILQFHNIGFSRYLLLARCKSKYLSSILRAKPLIANSGDIEVHMLLDHNRILEGIWSLYSFMYYASQPCCLVIHDDGTLTQADISLLNKMFPQCHIIHRITSDAKLKEHFNTHNLRLSAKLRETLIFGLKLFDLPFFTFNESFVLLDSDTLFFSRPNEIIDELVSKDCDIKHTAKYSCDNGYRYCLNEAELTQLLKRECIKNFNPGIIVTGRDSIEFGRIESYLRHSKFWDKDGRANYYAELTLWAMELTSYGAVPLANTYAICPTEFQNDELVFGHYCGGINAAYLYYTKAIPYLAAKLIN